jgi:hypothetical protein
MTTDQELKNALDLACVNMYLEYVNDYLTLEYMANNKNMSVNALKAMVDHGRKIFNNKN